MMPRPFMGALALIATAAQAVGKWTVAYDYLQKASNRRDDPYYQRHKAAIENVLLLRQIVRAIDAKSDRTVPEEFFHDMLDEQFSEEETLRQLETAINWGRYAELFDFDASRRRFVESAKLHDDADQADTAEIDA